MVRSNQTREQYNCFNPDARPGDFTCLHDSLFARLFLHPFLAPFACLGFCVPQRFSSAVDEAFDPSRGMHAHVHPLIYSTKMAGLLSYYARASDFRAVCTRYAKAYRESYYGGETSAWWEALVGNENATPTSVGSLLDRSGVDVLWRFVVLLLLVNWGLSYPLNPSVAE